MVLYGYSLPPTQTKAASSMPCRGRAMLASIRHGTVGLGMARRGMAATTQPSPSPPVPPRPWRSRWAAALLAR